MNQLKSIYQKLALRGVNLVQEKSKLEALFRPEKRYLKDGRERKLKIRNIDDILIHFWNGVEILNTNECWNWKRAVNVKSSNGIGNYGIMWIHMEKYKCHRLSYIISCGDIGKLCVCHKCDNPQCCNPNHLFLGSYRDNVLDCVRKGRKNSESGENRYNAKLNWEAVNDIRNNFKPYVTGYVYFIKKYLVSRTAISNVVYGNRWKSQP